MASITHPAQVAPTDPHSLIHRCNHCGTLCGTLTALATHKPGDCRSSRTMIRAGAWRGMAGIWWTVDGGWDDPTEGLPFSPLQVFENKERKLGQNGHPTLTPYPRRLSKFRTLAARSLT